MEVDVENDDEYGLVLDWVSVFQLGFINGMLVCVVIDEDEVEWCCGDLLMVLWVDVSGNLEIGEVGINEEIFLMLMELMGKIFLLKNLFMLFYQLVGCLDVKFSLLVVYCLVINIIVVDLFVLVRMGKVVLVVEYSLLQGDDMLLLIVMLWYVLVVQYECGLLMQSLWIVLWMVCLIGVVYCKMVVFIDLFFGQ